MNYVNEQRLNAALEKHTTTPEDFDQIANELCEKALKDARAQLHPLLRSMDPYRLEGRNEFVQAFWLALEQRIAKKLTAWQPRIQAVFRFDETRPRPDSPWDGSIHLLTKVPRLSKTIQALSQKLDQSLMQCLRGLGWPCFQDRQSVLEIQQVTPQEICRGIGYGGMFFAVYTRPVQVWPKNTSQERGSPTREN